MDEHFIFFDINQFFKRGRIWQWIPAVSKNKGRGTTGFSGNATLISPSELFCHGTGWHTTNTGDARAEGDRMQVSFCPAGYSPDVFTRGSLCLIDPPGQI